MFQHSRLAIIGAGSVGASIAYACMLRKVCSEILLVDIDEKTCEGQVLDLSDGAFLTQTKVRKGTYQEAGMHKFCRICDR
jgi:L-lactate dehydrogenase